jgi:hypothetical protein
MFQKYYAVYLLSSVLFKLALSSFNIKLPYALVALVDINKGGTPRERAEHFGELGVSPLLMFFSFALRPYLFIV